MSSSRDDSPLHRARERSDRAQDVVRTEGGATVDRQSGLRSAALHTGIPLDEFAEFVTAMTDQARKGVTLGVAPGYIFPGVAVTAFLVGYFLAEEQAKDRASEPDVLG